MNRCNTELLIRAGAGAGERGGDKCRGKYKRKRMSSMGGKRIRRTRNRKFITCSKGKSRGRKGAWHMGMWIDRSTSKYIGSRKKSQRSWSRSNSRNQGNIGVRGKSKKGACIARVRRGQELDDG